MQSQSPGPDKVPPRPRNEWWRPLPSLTSADARRILAARGVRAFADGFVALLLPIYLLDRGFSVLAIGWIVTSTLIGSAALTVWLGISAHRYARRPLLIAACVLMALTGLGFTLLNGFWPLLIIGFIGTLNPTSGDVSIFLPLEHAALAETTGPRERTALFARYSLVGTLMGAVGSLAAGIPDYITRWTSLPHTAALEVMFLLYGALGLMALPLYRKLSPRIETRHEAPAAPLHQSRKIVYRLAALFSLDSFGGGFFVQSLLALWLYQNFHLSIATTGSIFFWTNVCAAISYLLAVPISERIGLINTMVFTHLPSNLFLILVPFAPNLVAAIGLLLARSALSQMDVPTRTSYVMAVVSPEERPAAASVTSVPRSLAAALSPLLASYLFTLSSFGWPLIIGGALKASYDVLLLLNFRKVRPPEELGAVRT
jgi:MFS family permease